MCNRTATTGYYCPSDPLSLLTPLGVLTKSRLGYGWGSLCVVFSCGGFWQWSCYLQGMFDHAQLGSRGSRHQERDHENGSGLWTREAHALDELPQLWNVLHGEMSLVGPRPHALAHDNYYDQVISNYVYGHHMKPGLTGWAQVNGFRGETPMIDLMEKRVEYDVWYVSNWSIWLDLRIILRTALALMYQEAY